MNVSKRKLSFLKSDLPLTSKRARYIFSKPEESKNLLDAVRANRNLAKGQQPQTIHFASEKVAKNLVNMG